MPHHQVSFAISASKGTIKHEPVRNTGRTCPVAVGGILTPSAAASVGAMSCCTAVIEYRPAFTAGPTNIKGISTSYGQGVPCI